MYVYVRKRVNRDTRRRCIDSLATACVKTTATATDAATLSLHEAAVRQQLVDMLVKCWLAAFGLCMAAQFPRNACGLVSKRVNLALDT